MRLLGSMEEWELAMVVAAPGVGEAVATVREGRREGEGGAAVADWGEAEDRWWLGLL